MKKDSFHSRFFFFFFFCEEVNIMKVFFSFSEEVALMYVSCILLSSCLVHLSNHLFFQEVCFWSIKIEIYLMCYWIFVYSITTVSDSLLMQSVVMLSWRILYEKEIVGTVDCSWVYCYFYNLINVFKKYLRLFCGDNKIINFFHRWSVLLQCYWGWFSLISQPNISLPFFLAIGLNLRK